ncbi:sigma-70 family RNA polymerase sigma factor [Solimonas marina]|uniref:Sigma-70 family RNA polymerase sigma factor n=1 Tax=Solimonas marina TaxID=2714601 RepID=A0A969WH70_9GAMM|nr:sigma-70 family RNA polymerase sigma factor [Solimonas marina]NKF24615.1 sigma-70 family RNA polymerase sigma factor [Solimonas marina]
MDQSPFDDAELRALLPRLRRFALQLTQDPQAADDLVQSSLERALTRAGGKRPEGDLRAWLFSILYRRFVDEQRRQKRFSRVLALFGARDAGQASSPEDTIVAHSILAALAALPAEQRALLLLVSVEGLSYQEAANALDLPIGTVMSRLSRARQALRRLSDGDAAPAALRIVK